LAFQQREWEEALSWFSKARAVNPTHPEIPYYVALVFHRQQDNTSALHYMQQALQLMEDHNDKRKADARRWVREFEKLIKQAERDKAVADGRPSVTLDPDGSGIRISREEIGVRARPSLVAPEPTDDINITEPEDDESAEPET
jgi:tetratricopeptide (TPR) repeat protein